MECAVCYSDVSVPTKLVCGHVFCQDCVKSWYLKGTGAGCPMCRRPVYFKGFRSVRREWETESWYNQCQTVFGEVFDAQLETLMFIGQTFGLKRVSPRALRDLESTFQCLLMDGLLPDEVDYILIETDMYLSARLQNKLEWYNDPIKTKVARRDTKQRRKWTL